MRSDNESISFLAGYDAKDPSELKIIRRWIIGHQQGKLSVPVGVNLDNDMIYNYEVIPNNASGAIIGMCGQGKTEFIRTWLLSLAVNYAPTDVQFFIIEREFGELHDLEPLPHCAGHAIINSHMGSQGYRIAQAILHEVLQRQQLLENRLSGNTTESKPPELIIIIDVGSLRYIQYYEDALYQELIRVSRLGHSLGIRLFFTSQDPQMIEQWSGKLLFNYDYLCCFRVSNAQESRRLTGFEKAAELEAGTAFVKTSGTMSRVRMFYSSKYYVGDGGNNRRITEASLIVEHICKLCNDCSIEAASKIIIPKLPDEIMLKDVLEGGNNNGQASGQNIVIGAIDRIRAQETLSLDYQNMGHALVWGDSKSGKSTFIYSCIISICLSLPPEKIKIIFWGKDDQALSIIKRYPHVSQVADIERIDEIHSSSESIMKSLELEVQSGGRNNESKTILFIDDLDILLRKTNELCEFISTLVNSLTKSVAVIATATTGSIFPRQYYITSKMETPFCLHMSPKSEYIFTVGKPDHDLSKIPGRGFVKGNPPAECQVLSPLASYTEPVYSALKRYSDELKIKWEMEKSHIMWPRSSGYAIDIVFCVDASASMFHMIQMLKNRINSLYDEFANRYHLRNMSIESLRVRFVFFRDYLSDGKNAMLASDFVDLKKEPCDLRKMLAEIDAFGGINVPRAGFEALAIAMHSKWNTEAAFQRHFVVVISDSETRSLGESKAAEYYPKRMPDSFEKLSDLWEKMPSGTYLLMIAPEKPGWSTISDMWEHVGHFPSYKVGCRDYSYEDIIDILAYRYDAL